MISGGTKLVTGGVSTGEIEEGVESQEKEAPGFFGLLA